MTIYIFSPLTGWKFTKKSLEIVYNKQLIKLYFQNSFSHTDPDLILKKKTFATKLLHCTNTSVNTIAITIQIYKIDPQQTATKKKP